MRWAVALAILAAVGAGVGYTTVWNLLEPARTLPR